MSVHEQPTHFDPILGQEHRGPSQSVCPTNLPEERLSASRRVPLGIAIGLFGSSQFAVVAQHL